MGWTGWTEEDQWNIISINENPSLPSSYRDIMNWIRSRSRWTCSATNMLPESWFSDGGSYSSSAISNWYQKYSGGCDSIQVYFTGRDVNKNTNEICGFSFNVKHQRGMGLVEFAYH